MELLSRSRLFETRDVEAAQQFASQVWEKNRTVVREGEYGLRWNQIDLNAVSLAYIEHDCVVDLSAQGPLSDHFRAFLHLDGAIGHRLNGRPAVSDVRQTVVHAPGADLELDIQPFKLLLLSLPGDPVRKALMQRFNKIPAVEEWLGELHAAACAETLRSAAEWMARELNKPTSPLSAPGKPRHHAERLLLSLFTECLAEIAPTAADPILDLSESQVRRAEDWIEAHILEPIGIEEVSTAVGVGVRSLRRAFQRVRGCSPRNAIIQRRLRRVREALLRAEPGATVTSIAVEHGFLELGRFAMRYRQQFNESPSQTLAGRTIVK